MELVRQLLLVLKTSRAEPPDFMWSYGDGGTSDTTAAIHGYSYTNTTGTTFSPTIELIAISEDGCVDTTTRQVDVWSEVFANFSGDTAGCSPAFN